MRIIAGTWRGRALTAPAGQATRPTAERVRQALFDMLMHAPWGGRAALLDSTVLDAFAGTGALGLEALSRGAAHATFIEQDRTALAALRANVTALGAAERSRVLAADALRPPPGAPRSLVFLDPPYGQDMAAAVDALRRAGWIGAATIVVAETAAGAPPDLGTILAERAHGPALVTIWRGCAT
jgi:16S rRNA (guanine966-N2)-methyltransferase